MVGVMGDEHLRCYHEKDWGEVKAKVRVICEEQATQKDEMRDLRSSVKHDLEKAETAADSKFITKSEFDPIKKLVYGTALLMVAAIIKMVFVK
jgi:hypothetical protein